MIKRGLLHAFIILEAQTHALTLTRPYLLLAEL